MSLWAPPRSGPQLIDATAKPLPPLPSLPSRSPGRRWHQGATRLGYDRGLRRTGFHQKGKPASRGEDCDDDIFEEHIRPRSGAFKFGNSTYGMQTHGDRAHYQIEGLGSGRARQNGWINSDSSESLSVVDLIAAGPSVPPQWDRYGTCALASSAFPIGLAPVASHLLWRDI